DRRTRHRPPGRRRVGRGHGPWRRLLQRRRAARGIRRPVPRAARLRGRRGGAAPATAGGRRAGRARPSDRAAAGRAGRRRPRLRRRHGAGRRLHRGDPLEDRGGLDRHRHRPGRVRGGRTARAWSLGRPRRAPRRGGAAAGHRHPRRRAGRAVRDPCARGRRGGAGPAAPRPSSGMAIRTGPGPDRCDRLGGGGRCRPRLRPRLRGRCRQRPRRGHRGRRRTALAGAVRGPRRAGRIGGRAARPASSPRRRASRPGAPGRSADGRRRHRRARLQYRARPDRPRGPLARLLPG
ncbi:MAG: hypothetical protein AVDCRST_MAG79-2430, partial [uncultured Thermoleophilia bacterium]